MNTKRVVRTERRERPFKAGIITTVVGLVLVLIGGALTIFLQSAEVLFAIDRVAVGNPIEFTAEDRGYSLVYIRGELDTEDGRLRAISNLTCTVTAADGSTQIIEGSRQTVYTDSSLGSSIGSFDAEKGPTTVLCEFIRNPGGILQNYALAKNRQSAEIVSLIILGLGIIVGVVGSTLIVVGVRGRAVIERVPVGQVRGSTE